MTALRTGRAVAAVIPLLILAGCTNGSGDVVRIQDIHGLALDPQDANRLYVATHRGLFVGEGDTKWSSVTAEPFDMMGFTMHPRDGSIMYASGHPGRVGQGWAVGVVRSTDAGRTWTTLALKNEVDFHAMAMEPGSTMANDTIYGSHGGKLHVSTNGGTSWTTRALTFQVAALTVSPETGDVWAATSSGIQKNTRLAEGPWQIVNPKPALAVSASPDGTILYAYIDNGLAKSIDQGKTWTGLNWTVPSGDYPWGIAPSPTTSGPLYVGTAQGFIFKTTDQGASWTKIR